MRDIRIGAYDTLVDQNLQDLNELTLEVRKEKTVLQGT